MLSGRRYAVRSGPQPMNPICAGPTAHLEAARTAQTSEPVQVWRDGRRNLWQYLDGFWWDDDGLGAKDIQALVLQRKRRLEQKLQSARSLMRAEADGRPTRVPIPIELRRAVLSAMAAIASTCGGAFDLQYRPPFLQWRSAERRHFRTSSFSAPTATGVRATRSSGTA